MSTAGIPVLGSVTLSGATLIQRKERDYIIEHQIAGKDGGLVERVGSSSTRFEIKGFFRESGADTQYQSLVALLGTTSNLSIPTFGSGYFLAASGTVVFVEAFQANWIPGYGNPAYDYNLKLVSTNKTQPAATTPLVSIVQRASAFGTSVTTLGKAFPGPLTAGNAIIASISVQNGGVAVINSYTVSDNASPATDIYTLQKRTTDQGNGQGDAVFSAPVVNGAGQAVSVTVTLSLTGGVNPNIELQIYEVKGLASATATSTSQTEGGVLPITLSTNGALTISAFSCTVSVDSRVVTFSGTLDSSNGSGNGNGSGQGTWQLTVNQANITFVEVVEASFS